MYYLGALGNYIEPPINLNRTTLEFSEAATFDRMAEVRVPPSLGEIPDTDFDTIYSLRFTLDPRVLVQKEIWLVQDMEDFSQKHPVPKNESESAEKGNSTAD